MRTVPVLMYHHVNPHQGDLVTISPKVFEEQMRFLHEARFRTLSAGELLGFVTGDLTLREKAVMVTFDDGWLDNYLYAFPVMKRYGIRATVFLVTDWLERASEQGGAAPSAVPRHRESKALLRSGDAGKVALTWPLVEEMSRSGLVEFHSHTKSHPDCGLLRGEALREELCGSRAAIEKRTGKNSSFLCWPYGKFSEEAVEAARRCGYLGVFTTRPGVAKRASDPFAINRIVVKDRTGWFKKRMALYSTGFLAGLYLAIKKK